MKIHIFSIGHKPPQWVKMASELYLKRFTSPWQIATHTIAQTKNAAKDDLLLCDLIDKKAPNAFVMALDEHGQSFTSQQLHQRLSQYQAQQGSIALIIGATNGLTAPLKAKAHLLWSLSPLTFPHMMVRVILYEQLYRCFCLSKNHPYHRD